MRRLAIVQKFANAEDNEQDSRNRNSPENDPSFVKRRLAGKHWEWFRRGGCRARRSIGNPFRKDSPIRASGDLDEK
jgi:hypothetical protein